MSLEKKPFVNYTLGVKNQAEQGKIFTVRLNPEEYKELLEAMHLLHISNASTAIKELAFAGKNVICTMFKPDFLKWLADGSRRVDEAKLSRLVAEKEQNVIQKLENL